MCLLEIGKNKLKCETVNFSDIGAYHTHAHFWIIFQSVCRK